jgi:elongation factor P hydroxylase
LIAAPIPRGRQGIARGSQASAMKQMSHWIAQLGADPSLFEDGS